MSPEVLSEPRADGASEIREEAFVFGFPRVAFHDPRGIIETDGRAANQKLALDGI